MRLLTGRPILAAFLVWVLVTSAQQPAPKAPQATAAGNSNQQQNGVSTSKGFKFDISTQLVVEDIIIKDKSGNQPTNLEIDATRLSDPAYAAQAAFLISKGGTDFTPWTMFRNGQYKRFLPNA